MALKVAVLGSGDVGETLADGFLKKGYDVMRGSRDPGKLDQWLKQAGPKAKTGTFEESAKFGDVVVLAVKGLVVEELVKKLGSMLDGKTVIDPTNPISEKAPTNGVLHFFTDMNFSLLERLQKAAPKANLVKAFSCVGSPFMIDPAFPGGKPTMFICGNSVDSKKKVTEILSQFGWETQDMGFAEAARAIEPLCMLWCIPGMMQNQWNHAFKLLKG